MSLALRDCLFLGSALPEPFVVFELESILNKHALLPKNAGAAGQALQKQWEGVRFKLRALGEEGGSIRVANHVLEPLLVPLGYERLEPAALVPTREGEEDGGRLFIASDGKIQLRAWTVQAGVDLDAPNRRGRAYRFSPAQVASRVLQATGERVGLITDGQELRLLLADPARPDSHLTIRLDTGWRRAREVPDSYRLVLALASPAGLSHLHEIVEQARLSQSHVTDRLRDQAQAAVLGFVQQVLDAPQNQAKFVDADKDLLARRLWREGLVLVYRLLFIFKLEASADPARAFSFASTTLWRNAYSPNTGLAEPVRRFLDRGANTGTFLASSLRATFRLFETGLQSSELKVSPLGGMLFGNDAMPFFDSLHWPERGVALLLHNLLWTDGLGGRARVHYGPLDVEDLGRVYEALLELEPGIASESMVRLRRNKLEVVVPVAQGERYKDGAADNGTPDDEDSEDDGEKPNKKKVTWIEEIPAGRFFLRVGLGRKASGSYYTPEPFVRFLVQETLRPQVSQRSPPSDPQPVAILGLRVLDPAMGSGHFLVGACRFLAEQLYEACRLCDDQALLAENKAAAEKDPLLRKTYLDRAAELRQRIWDLPDPNNELISYLPSRAPEGSESGVSQAKALALCRRLVAVHCLYGVDKNELAVELAKVTLWLESYAEGLPLTFMDHRLVCGDSVTGAGVQNLLRYPLTGRPLEDLFARGLSERMTASVAAAISLVSDLEASVGKDVSDIEAKRAAKARLEAALSPWKALAAAWAGGVMLGEGRTDDPSYAALGRALVEGRDPAEVVKRNPDLKRMVQTGSLALSYELAFPEVFFPEGLAGERCGFDAVVGNPPWEGLDTSNREFFAGIDFGVMETEEASAIDKLIKVLLARPGIAERRQAYEETVLGYKRAAGVLFSRINLTADGVSAATPDMYQFFTERALVLTRKGGRVGLLLPSAIHANDGAAGLRRFWLDENILSTCFSFENRKKIFDIHRSYKFSAMHGVRGGRTEAFTCAFYLHDLAFLFSPEPTRQLVYSHKFLERTTGASLNFLELREQGSVPIAEAMYGGRAGWFGNLRHEWKILPTEELHTSKQKHRTRPLAELAPDVLGDPRNPIVAAELARRGILPVLKGEFFHQLDPLWGKTPDRGTSVELMRGKDARVEAARFYRFVIRRQASSTNERTVIAHVAAPGAVFFDSALPEKAPQDRPDWHALVLASLCNSFSFDWLVRQLVASNVTFNFLDTVPVPRLSETKERFVAHCALRIVCVHEGYRPLWQEQLAGASAIDLGRIFPVLENEEAKWRVKACIDAVIADAYGLDVAKYNQILDSFSHSSYPAAREMCLAAYAELTRGGVERFIRTNDPFHQSPLPQDLPVAVLQFGGAAVTANTGVAESVASYGTQAPLFGHEAPSATGRRRRRRR